MKDTMWDSNSKSNDPDENVEAAIMADEMDKQIKD